MRNPDDWRRIAAEAATRAKDAGQEAHELRLKRDDEGAAHLRRTAHYWQAVTNNIAQVLGAEAAYPPEPYPSAEVAIPSPSEVHRERT